ncbi:mannan endo-1,6-alpha-mannosidase Dfg5p [[Candida] jaroonii]|uniref:Mannan endo-1,6-alpha-mannosidase Dfg5p n=1 Tax=[Candida] jaroonii TaxID=467808 RepID=A0ACA9Y1F3_9ASCO|nr:mannan endo-1,6-alpha-mannosidase Dfg5p [[Candida] jaroonii]
MKYSGILSTIWLITVSLCVELDLDDLDSVCEAASSVVWGELNYYEGFKYGGTVGMFSTPYYWWHAGEAFGGLVDYYAFCQKGNDTFEKFLIDGMFHQAGEDYNYIPSNQSLTEGNDDQGVWGMAIMEAAERNISQPSKDHSWISLTQAVYNTMNARWDDAHCGGGLRWQIFTWNSGYDYKNTISNGLLFHLAARLARYLDNETYVETAERVWNWMHDVGFYNRDGDDLTIFDGAKIGDNCSDVTTLKWSYSYGVFLSGCAYLYNYTEDATWKERALEIIHVAQNYFVASGYMSEATCAPSNRCNNDQRSFRSLYSRCLGVTTVLIPETKEVLNDYLTKSAEGAAQSCSGGSDGVTCGEDWSYSGWDGVYGLGEQMSALEVILANVQTEFSAPLSVQSGGNNASDSEAGLNTQDHTNTKQLDITSKDKAGAGVLTAVVLAIILGGSIWMIL